MDPGDGSDGGYSGLLGAIIDAITGGFSNLVGFLGDKFNEVYNAVVSIVDYLNPFSDNFILKVAFVPEEGYFQRKIEELNAKAQDSVGLFGQLKDTFNAIVEAITDQDEWEGVKVNISSYGVGGIGEITIVDPTFVNYASNKIKFWISGLIWFMLLMWLIKKIAGFWGRGDE